MQGNQPSPRSAIAVGIIAILFGALSDFNDPQLSAIVVSAGAMVVSFGLMLVARSLNEPRSRLAVWLVTFQFIGIVVLAVLAESQDVLYLLGVAGVLAVSLLTIGMLRDSTSS
jgi:hypothetical protein